MADALETLQHKLAENERQISDLVNREEILRRNNEHLSYAIELLKSQHQSNQQETVEVKKTLKDTVIDVFKDGGKFTIEDAWNKVSEQGIITTKATINTTLYNLANKGILSRPEPGIYEKHS